jgi:hypothetical protein
LRCGDSAGREAPKRLAEAGIRFGDCRHSRIAGPQRLLHAPHGTGFKQSPAPT